VNNEEIGELLTVLEHDYNTLPTGVIEHPVVRNRSKELSPLSDIKLTHPLICSWFYAQYTV
jgi:hypothetical protein